MINCRALTEEYYIYATDLESVVSIGKKLLKALELKCTSLGSITEIGEIFAYQSDKNPLPSEMEFLCYGDPL
jgi:hypothetical protein